ncbi:MAG: bifunctional pyr operon transcriptional regulator/uracil phosphoribosyltransferase PyrR [Cyclobacteriaceae bacterium]
MSRKNILNEQSIAITIQRLCHQLIENHTTFENSILIGLQPRGSYLANRIKDVLEELVGKEFPLGLLDTTFHRDDFRRREFPAEASSTHIPFTIEGKRVILIDDVLFTGRSVRAAMDAMITFGRPEKVELLTLIDRKYTRDLPIEANYVGKYIDSFLSQKVEVSWKEHKGKKDAVWLVTN